MSWYFSKKLGNVRLNFSKSGIGYSIGTKGARLTKRANAKSNTSTSSEPVDSNNSLPKGLVVSLWVGVIVFIILAAVGIKTFDIALLLFTVFVLPIIEGIIFAIITAIVGNKDKKKEEDKDRNE